MPPNLLDKQLTLKVSLVFMGLCLLTRCEKIKKGPNDLLEHQKCREKIKSGVCDLNTPSRDLSILAKASWKGFRTGANSSRLYEKLGHLDIWGDG